MQPTSAALAGLLILATLLPGCNSRTKRPPTYPVTGTVTMKGKPLTDARVIFVAVDSATEAAAGISDAVGKYALTTFVADDGAQPGEYRVKVSKYDSKAATKAEKQEYLSYEEEQKRTFAVGELPTPPAKNLLPKKYENEATSGITHTVPSGPSTLDIKLD